MLRSGSCLSLWERWHCTSNAGEVEPVNNKKGPLPQGQRAVSYTHLLNADVSFYDYLNVHPDADFKLVAQTEDASHVAIPVRKRCV